MKGTAIMNGGDQYNAGGGGGRIGTNRGNIGVKSHAYGIGREAVQS